MLRSIGSVELRSILEEQGMVEIVCEFCSCVYQRDSAAIESIINDLDSQ
jgi:redox-regulated HSP33 family molecular chaperone